MAPLDRTQRRVLAATVVVALGLRVAWCAVAAGEPAGFHDPGVYRLLAHQLAHFEGYVLADGPTAYYPIGYPAVLGAAFAAGRFVGLDAAAAEILIAAVVNLVAGMAAVVLAFALGRHIVGPWAGIGAAAVVAVLPNLVFHTAVPLSETLFNAAYLGFALLVVRAMQRPATRRFAAAGALLGASALVRPIALPVLPLLLLVLPWRAVVTVALAALAVISPWTVRNAARMDAFVPLSTNTGDNLCMSRQPGATGGFMVSEHCFGGPDLEGLVRPEYEVRRDAQGRRLAVEFVRRHPGEELRLWLDRLGATLRHDHDALDAVEGYGDGRFLADGHRDLYRRVADGAWYALGVLGLAAAGAVVAVRRLRADRRLVLLVVAAVGVLVPVVVFFGDARFKVPVLPVLAVLVPAVVSSLRRSPGCVVAADPWVPRGGRRSADSASPRLAPRGRTAADRSSDSRRATTAAGSARARRPGGAGMALHGPIRG
jgi:hypothetical protein